MTPSTEKAISWIVNLAERSFVGTESRLLTLFELLRQMTEGSESDPAVRIAELQKRRDEIDREIARAHRHKNVYVWLVIDDISASDAIEQQLISLR